LQDSLPKVSFIICTYSVGGLYDCDHLIIRCLNSIFRQNYPKEKIEVICVDGGSRAHTFDILKKYPVRVHHNKKTLPEGQGMGKSQGVELATGEIIAMVDQDNELIGDNWLREMILPFENQNVFGAACILYAKRSDNPANRYLALVGGDPFAAPFSLDGMLGLGTAKLVDCENYSIINMSLKDFFITGGNCFLYRRSALEKIGGYTKDIDTVWKIIQTETNVLAVPKIPRTHHAQATSLWRFLLRKLSYARKHFKNKALQGEVSWLPKDARSFTKFFQATISNLLVLPNVPIAVLRFLQSADPAWLIHPIASLLGTIIYIYAVFTSRVSKK
jgi:glycosyltransferase involved in cell wall biosynthesis